MDAVVHVASDGRVKRFLANRIVWLVVVLAVVLSAAGVLTWHILDNQKQQRALTNQIVSAEADIAAGNYLNAEGKFNLALPKAHTKSDKVRIYTGLASASANLNQLPHAISYFEQKHQLDPSTVNADAYVLATLYDRTGQTAKASAQYKIALAYEQSQKQNMLSNSDTGAIQARIQQLEGKQ